MHYRIRYMQVKCQLNRDKRFVKTMNTKNKLNLQLPIAIFKNWPFQTCIIVKRTCISIFSKIGLVDQSKLCTQIYLQKFASCNSNFEKSRLSDMHYPLTDIHAHFEINRPVRYRNTAKINYFHRRTDGQTSRTTTIGMFFRKKQKLLKIANIYRYNRIDGMKCHVIPEILPKMYALSYLHFATSFVLLFKDAIQGWQIM